MKNGIENWEEQLEKLNKRIIPWNNWTQPVGSLLTQWLRVTGKNRNSINIFSQVSRCLWSMSIICNDFLNKSGRQFLKWYRWRVGSRSIHFYGSASEIHFICQSRAEIDWNSWRGNVLAPESRLKWRHGGLQNVPQQKISPFRWKFNLETRFCFLENQPDMPKDASKSWWLNWNSPIVLWLGRHLGVYCNLII